MEDYLEISLSKEKKNIKTQEIIKILKKSREISSYVIIRANSISCHISNFYFSIGLQLVYQCSKTNFARNHSAGRSRSQPLYHLQAWQETPLVHDLFAASLSLLHSLPADHGNSFHKNTNHQRS